MRALSMVMRPESFGTVCMFLAYTPQICHEDEEHEDGFVQVDMKDPEGDPWYGEEKPEISPMQSTAAYVNVMQATLDLVRAVVAHKEVGAAALAALRASSHFDAFVSRLVELAQPPPEGQRMQPTSQVMEDEAYREETAGQPSIGVEFVRSPLPQIALELLFVLCGGRQSEVSDGVLEAWYSRAEDPYTTNYGLALGPMLFGLLLGRADALGVRGEPASNATVMAFKQLGKVVSKGHVANVAEGEAYRFIADLAPKVAAAEAAAAVAALAASDRFVGKFVTIHGLVGRPELNTRRGLATGFNEEKGRYQVSLEAVPVPGLEFDCALLIKPDNLNVEVAVRVPAN